MLNRLLNTTTFIAGSEKNAGKTTFLNYALNYLRSSGKLAYLTIGIDGEKEDVVFGNAKPRIYAIKNDIIVTSEFYINSSTFEILEVFPQKTVLGRIVVAKTLRDSFVELVGPEDNSKLSTIINSLKVNHNADTILIDGAVNRITQVSAFNNSSFVYVMKVEHKNCASVMDKLKLISLCRQIPAYGSELLDEYSIKGALTSLKIASIPDYVKNLVIDDFTKLFLRSDELIKLQDKYQIYFRENYNLQFVVINNKDIEENEFDTMLSKQQINLPYIYNPYFNSRGVN